MSGVPNLSELDAPVDGWRVLDALLEVFQRYVVFPSEQAAHVVVLWVAATHAQTVWACATRLVINSPEKQCGKTRLLDMLELTVRAPLVSSNISPAAIYRSINQDDPPTLLLDEADAIFSNKKVNRDQAEDLRGLLNSGFARNRPTIRCVGPNSTPTSFETFCMAGLAGIGDYAPDTITDRAVVITMRRRVTGEKVRPYRIRRDEPAVREAGQQVADWVASELHALADAEPAMPVEDREADTWESLVAIADAAGGDWPERARAACLHFTQAARDDVAEQSSAVRLLRDIRAAFDEHPFPEMTSKQLIEGLVANPDSPWGAWGLTQSQLARRLHPYGIKPDRIKPVHGQQARGYRREWFEDAWSRYLSDDSARVASQGVTPSSAQVGSVTAPPPVTARGVTPAAGVTRLTSDDDAVTGCDGPWMSGLCCICATALPEVEAMDEDGTCSECYDRLVVT